MTSIKTPLCLREGSRGTSSASLGAKPLVRSDGGQYTFIQVTNHDNTQEVDRAIRRHAMRHLLTQQKIADPKNADHSHVMPKKSCVVLPPPLLVSDLVGH